jgi:uncharacterized membrane protein
MAYRLEFLLQVRKPSLDVISVFDIVLGNLQVTATALQYEIDQLRHCFWSIRLEFAQPLCRDVFEIRTAGKYVRCQYS